MQNCHPKRKNQNYLFSESGFDDKILEEAANAENITLCNLSDIVEKKNSEAQNFDFDRNPEFN